MRRILILGGTTEASQLAEALAASGTNAVFSYAGRTYAPAVQPLPTRIGGFGGVAGLTTYLRQESITHVIDATHPFAGQISRNAHAACAETKTPLLSFERPEWLSQPGDNWRRVPDLAGAVLALPLAPARVFLAIGKQHVAGFAAQPQHHYLLRLVDAPEIPPPLPDCKVILARGPFKAASDLQLLRDHRISHIVAKNSGGTGAAAKIEAARTLGLPVIMIDRPEMPDRPRAGSVAEVMGWLSHSTGPVA